MMINRTAELSLTDAEYIKDRWRQDVNACVACIMLVFLLLATTIRFDMIFLFSDTRYLLDHDIFFAAYVAIRIFSIGISAALIVWLLSRRNSPAITKYARYIFIWELIIACTAFTIALSRPTTFYLSIASELPVLILIYLVMPQHNRLLRITPPVLYSIGIGMIFYFYKEAPVHIGFMNVYEGLIVSNITGMYFSEKAYAKDRQLYFLSNSDPLTGLHNRRYMEKKLQEEWQRCRRQQWPLSLCLVDLDCFKSYNDTYGHQAGDEILRQIGTVLLHAARRPGDIIARYGGEEMIVILPQTSLDECQSITTAIMEHLEQLKIPHKTSLVSSHITASIGCASVIPSADTGFDALLKQADEALYQAKMQGRNRVVF